MKTPPKGTHYLVSDGTKADTLEDWQRGELMIALKGDTTLALSLVNLMIKKANEIVEILSVKEAGRPKGRKDSKPRKPKGEPYVTLATDAAKSNLSTGVAA